jgi:anti-sigma-K factor RskA
MAPDNHILDDIPAFALGSLDKKEHDKIQSHINQCPQCQAELFAYNETIGLLALAVTQNSPSSRTKYRLLDQIKSQDIRPTLGQTFSRWFHTAPAFSLISLSLVVMLLISNLFLYQKYSDLNQMHRHGYSTVLLDGTDTSPNSKGMVVYTNDGKSGFLVVNDLPSLPLGKNYQLWLIKGTDRTNGGFFSVAADGYHVMEITSPDNLTNYDGFGITIEPAGGSPKPTGKKVLGGSF